MAGFSNARYLGEVFGKEFGVSLMSYVDKPIVDSRKIYAVLGAGFVFGAIQRFVL